MTAALFMAAVVGYLAGVLLERREWYAHTGARWVGELPRSARRRLWAGRVCASANARTPQG